MSCQPIALYAFFYIFPVVCFAPTTQFRDTPATGHLHLLLSLPTLFFLPSLPFSGFCSTDTFSMRPLQPHLFKFQPLPLDTHLCSSFILLLITYFHLTQFVYTLFTISYLTCFMKTRIFVSYILCFISSTLSIAWHITVTKLIYVEWMNK